MSLFGAMFSAVSGMNSQSQALATISDNISNLNTVGYKSTQARFSTLVTQQATESSYSPGGVRMHPFQLVDKQGLLVSSDSPTDIAISGKGFLVVNARNNSSGQFLYTRAGSFTVDRNGFLQNSAGYYLQGWPTDPTGKPTVANTSITSTLSTVNVTGISGVAVGTSNVDLGINLPASAPTGDTESSNVLIYDSLGVSHNMHITWTKSAINTWDFAIGDPTLASDPTVQTGTITAGNVGTVTFNGDGTLASTTLGSLAGGPPPVFTASPTIDIDFTNPAATGTGAQPSAISLNLGALNTSNGLTQFSGSFTTTFIHQDGVQFGLFNGVRIDDSGLVTALFDNGETRPIYKIPLATFPNASALEAKAGNAYGQTDGSGLVLLNFADQTQASKINSGSLESSNVDLGTEFTNMIVDQRAFSANTRVITTADQMLNDLVQVIR